MNILVANMLISGFFSHRLFTFVETVLTMLNGLKFYITSKNNNKLGEVQKVGGVGWVIKVF